jgi:hypothetical protein
MATNDFPSSGNGERAGLMGTIREKATSGLSSQKDRAADGLGTVVEAVRQTGQQLRDKSPALAGYADNAAATLERWASDFRAKDVTVMAEDVKRFARRRPAMFIGGAVVLGIVAARLVKGAAAEAQENWRSERMPASGGRDQFGGSRSLSGGSSTMDLAADRSSSRPSTMGPSGSRARS